MQLGHSQLDLDTVDRLVVGREDRRGGGSVVDVGTDRRVKGGDKSEEYDDSDDVVVYGR